MFPIIGGPVIAIIAGMIITMFFKDKTFFVSGIKFTSKKILQYAVVLLGFGLNLNVILETGKQSLPIILATISTSLILAFVLCKLMKIPGKISTLVGVGSSICGGSAIAATAPVIDADDEEVAQAISVIFFYNVLAALIFPHLGSLLGFSTVSGYGFGILAFLRTRKEKKNNTDGKKVSLKSIFPFFILYFIAASVITTIAVNCGVDVSFFAPIKTLSKFFSLCN